MTKQSSGDYYLNIKGNLVFMVSAFFISRKAGPVVPTLNEAVVDLPKGLKSILPLVACSLFCAGPLAVEYLYICLSICSWLNSSLYYRYGNFVFSVPPLVPR